MDDSNNYVILNGERVSAETLKPVIPHQAPKRKRPLWLRLMLRHPIWTYVLVVGGVGAVLSHYWRVVEKVAPPLNEFIHRDVSDRNDAAYQLFKFGESRKQYVSGTRVCDVANSGFAACRSAMLRAKPALTDMGIRIGKLETGWQKELAAKTVPENCKDALSTRYASLREYVENEQRAFSIYEQADPNSDASIALAKERLDLLGEVEKEATERIRSRPPWPEECNAY